MSIDAASLPTEIGETTGTTQVQPASATIPDLHVLFDLPEAAVDLVKKSEFLALASGKRPTGRKLRQVFFDTETYRLGRAGVAIGIQTAAQRRQQILRDIKLRPTGGRVQHGSDSPLDGDNLDLARIAFLPGMDPALPGRLAQDTLVPVFASDINRITWPVAWGDTKISVVLETGSTESSSGRRELRQLDLRLLDGPPGGLYDFALGLARANPLLTLAEFDRMQQGYILAANADWWPLVLEPHLERDMSVRAGLLAIGRAGSAALRQEITTLSAAFEAENIHQARVAFRRLRSVLSVFSPTLPQGSRRQLSAALADFATRLGEAREWDVFVSETLDPMAAAMGDDGTLRSMKDAASAMREQAAAGAQAALGAPDFMAISLKLGAWFDAGIWPEPPTPEAAVILDRPLGDFARDLLQKRHRKLVAVATAMKDPRIAELHALRIDAKKLRYTAEFFRPLFPNKVPRTYVQGLKEIQEVLGKLNDASVARGLVNRLASSDQKASARAAGMIAGWTGAEIAGALRRFTQAWGDFAEMKKFWKD